MESRLISSAQVAQFLDKSITWFYLNRDRLYAQDFPRPVLGEGRNGRAKYDPEAIKAWLAARRKSGIEPAGDGIRMNHEWNQRLDERLADLAVEAI